jgi:beta-glucanase (GH16 family)
MSQSSRVLVGGICLLAVFSVLYIPRVLSDASGKGWHLIWADNFSGKAGARISGAKWKYDTGHGVFGNGEIETMTSSTRNVYLDGAGNLDIRALDQDGNWTSGRIQSTGLFGARTGGELRVVASIRQPAPAGGLGYWPAFWMLGPGRWPQDGEIDILEDVNALDLHSGALHCGNLTQANGDGTYGPCHEHTGLSSGMLPCQTCQAKFHSYSVVIDRRHANAESISWYLDGRQFYRIDEHQLASNVWHAAVDHTFSIIFDLAIGGSYPDSRCSCVTPTSATTSGGVLSVQYLHVYER